jgi:16S rRNA (adenine(1408)-N(1))-methyltransferase
VIGVDANADPLRAASRRAAAKPARGGAANALFGRLPFEEAPGELAGLADAVSVLLPWGSLLRATALPEPEALVRLRALCKPDAELHVAFGYGAAREASAIRDLGLPAPGAPGALAALEAEYRRAGFAVRARAAPLDEIRALETTWAKKLAHSGHDRAFVSVRGRAIDADGDGDGPEPGSAKTSKY